MSVTTDNRLAEKAQRYLAERRVQIVEVRRQLGALTYADCLVFGSGEFAYSVSKFGSNPWTCSCPARVEVCSHVVSCALVVPDEAGDRG